MKLLKRHHIIYAMAFEGLNGANRVQILQRAHLKAHGNLSTFNRESNRCYFMDTTETSNGRDQSLIQRGLIERESADVYVLTDLGREMADAVQRINNGARGNYLKSVESKSAAFATAYRAGRIPPTMPGASTWDGQCGTLPPIDAFESKPAAPTRGYRDIKDDAVRLTGKYMANGFKETPELQAETIRLIGEVLSRL